MAEKKTVTNKAWLALLAVVLCCASFSGYGCSSQAMSPGSSLQQGGDKDPIFTSCSCNDPAGTIDPGKDKDVGCCTCGIDSANATNATVTIGNAYPGYKCRINFTIQNTATQTVNITIVNVTAPLAIDVIADPSLNGTTLQPGAKTDGFIDVHVNDSAAQSTTYTFTVKIDGD